MSLDSLVLSRQVFEFGAASHPLAIALPGIFPGVLETPVLQMPRSHKIKSLRYLCPPKSFQSSKV